MIGGGIHGAGVAQAAAAAGYRTLIVERGDWGTGTSSKSSKLIHGGLRYLQQGHLGLVRESLRERDILLRIAPHLVRLNRFYIPVYRSSRYRPWQLRIGLSLYALLGGLRKAHRFATVPRHRWASLNGLDQRGLQAVFTYWDAQTDDRRLTAAVAASAAQQGADTACPATLTGGVRHSSGYSLKIRQANDIRTVETRVLVNAGGPWANQVAGCVDPQPPKAPVELVRGSHLVLAPPLAPHCFYLEAPGDGRAIFALPWQDQTLLGTTEVPYSGDPDAVAITAGEEHYLLESLRHYFPEYVDGPARVVERMSGLRVLPASADRPFQRSREIEIVEAITGRSGYLALYGGKLTGYRATGEKVIAKIAACLGSRRRKADTRTLPLP